MTSLFFFLICYFPSFSAFIRRFVEIFALLNSKTNLDLTLRLSKEIQTLFIVRRFCVQIGSFIFSSSFFLLSPKSLLNENSILWWKVIQFVERKSCLLFVYLIANANLQWLQMREISVVCRSSSNFSSFFECYFLFCFEKILLVIFEYLKVK